MNPNGTDGAQAPGLLVPPEQPVVDSPGELSSSGLATPDSVSKPAQSDTISPENPGQLVAQTSGNENSTQPAVWQNPEVAVAQPAFVASDNQVAPVGQEVVHQFRNFQQFEEFSTDHPKNLGAAGQGLEDLIGRRNSKELV